jgi:hypothetical protein
MFMLGTGLRLVVTRTARAMLLGFTVSARSQRPTGTLSPEIVTAR